jgi:hypothetical protein
MGLTWGANDKEVTDMLNVWTVAERFHYPIEYVEGWSLARWREFLSIEDGKAHSRNSLTKRG